MHASAQPYRLGKQKSRTRRPVAAPCGGFANGFLMLPILSKAVPVCSVSQEDNTKWLKIAKLCAELIGDDEIVIHGKTTARDIVSLSLSAWASKHCADIKVLDGFELLASVDLDGMSHQPYGHDEDKSQKWFIGLNSTQNQRYFNVKNKIEALEKAHPGLARTAVFYAEAAGYRTIPMFSPAVGFHHGANLYWYGTDNDGDYHEERESYGEELDEDVFLPSQYGSAFPELFFTGECLQPEVLHNIAAEKDITGETARIILSIMDLIEQKAGLPDLSGLDADSAFFSCFMGVGGDNDMLMRVLDDFYQSVNECSDSYSELHGVAELSFDKLAFLTWRDEMERGFALYTQLDRLMGLIGEIE